MTSYLNGFKETDMWISKAELKMIKRALDHLENTGKNFTQEEFNAFSNARENVENSLKVFTTKKGK